MKSSRFNAEAVTEKQYISPTALIERIKELESKLEYVRNLGQVYVYPPDWRSSKMGGPPAIDDYEKIDLSDI